MKILVCGSRYYSDYQKIFDFIKSLDRPVKIIAGACRGADTLAIEVAKKLGLNYTEYPANWARYGKRAGPLRNQAMLNLESPDLVAAFHPDIDSSKGTKDMLRRAVGSGIQVVVYQ